MIEGGYYIKARKIQNSDIAFAPPHVREIWDWLIKEVNHNDNGNFKRGQTVRTLNDIQDGLKWFVGYRKEMYSKSKCEMAMNWLRKRGMITTTKTTRGLIITVCKYDTYQNPKNYETNNEKTTKPTRNEQPSDTINKNEKNDNNEKKYIYSKFYDDEIQNTNGKLKDIYIQFVKLLFTGNEFNYKFNTILSMSGQLSYESFEKYCDVYGKDKLKEKIIAIENNGKKYKNFNMTLNNWLKK